MIASPYKLNYNHEFLRRIVLYDEFFYQPST